MASNIREALRLMPCQVTLVGEQIALLRPSPDGKPRRARKPFKGTKDQLVAAIFGGQRG